MAQTINRTNEPWGLHPLPEWVLQELKNRASETGQNPISISEQNETEIPFSGPRSAWVRFFSNGISRHPDADLKEGFLLGGVYDFKESYGFTGDGKCSIGVDAMGRPHRISTDKIIIPGNGINGQRVSPDFPHRPPPSIESISVENAGTNQTFPGLCRKTTIRWKCFSLAQLEYLTPYFLTPRISCLVEWGWNHYNTNSLVYLNDKKWLDNMFKNASFTTEWIRKSRGNYDAHMGFIFDYGFRSMENGGYDCYTVVMGANRLLQGMQTSTTTYRKKEQNGAITQLVDFKRFVKEYVPNFDTFAPDGRTAVLGEIRIPNAKDLAFRLKPENATGAGGGSTLWISMKGIVDIINRYFTMTMTQGPNATSFATPTQILSFDITNTVVCAHPVLKSTQEFVLVPNQYAPRFAFEMDTRKVEAFVAGRGGGGASATVPNTPTMQSVSQASLSRPDDATYDLLFKEPLERITSEEQYRGMPILFDNLKQLINPAGSSFPVYDDANVVVNTSQGVKKSQELKAGYWGYLSDLFFSATKFIDIIDRSDSLLTSIEEILQIINTSLCGISRLRLVAPQYGNTIYTIIDENLPGINTQQSAKELPRLTIGANDSAYIKSATLDVRMSPEMMGQIISRANIREGDLATNNTQPNSNTTTGNQTGRFNVIQTDITRANPIISIYAAGDRLYYRGELSSLPESPNNQRLIRGDLAQQKAKRSIGNNNTFLTYRQTDRTRGSYLSEFILCEKNSDFFSSLLSVPGPNTYYINNNVMPGTTLTLEFLGISGIDFLSQFTVEHIPEAYSYTNVVWQVSDVKHNVEDKLWTTTIVAVPRQITKI